MKIQISHLKEGLHHIDVLEPAEKFGLDDTDTFQSDIAVSLQIDKQTGSLYIRQLVKTKAKFACDRCAEGYTTELKSDDRIVYTSDLELIKYDDSLRPLAKDQTEIDISEDVREALLLAVPVKKLCDEKCKGICPQCGTNLNKSTCNCTQTRMDPRWETLKKLYQKEEK